MTQRTDEIKDEEAKLLEEYKILTGHYQHEDKILEDRSKFLSTIIIALFVAATGILTSPHFPDKSMIYFLSSLGIILCFVWWSIANISSYYIKLRMLQAIEIEKKLGFTTFQTEWKLCYDRTSATIGDRYMPAPRKHWLMGWATPKVLASIFLVLWLVLITYTLMLPFFIDP